MIPITKLPQPLLLFLLLALTAGLAAAEESPPEIPAPRDSLVLKASLLITGSHFGPTGDYVLGGTAGEYCTGMVNNESMAGVNSGFWPVFYRLAMSFVSPVPEFLQTNLGRIFPNPFNPSTTIEYTLAHECEVRLEVYNLRGELVRQLVWESQTPGPKSATWDGNDRQGRRSASGLYLCRLQAGNYQAVNKMLLLK